MKTLLLLLVILDLVIGANRSKRSFSAENIPQITVLYIRNPLIDSREKVHPDHTVDPPESEVAEFAATYSHQLRDSFTFTVTQWLNYGLEEEEEVKKSHKRQVGFKYEERSDSAFYIYLDGTRLPRDRASTTFKQFIGAHLYVGITTSNADRPLNHISMAAGKLGGASKVLGQTRHPLKDLITDIQYIWGVDGTVIVIVVPMNVPFDHESTIINAFSSGDDMTKKNDISTQLANKKKERGKSYDDWMQGDANKHKKLGVRWLHKIYLRYTWD